jgi:DNA excision repair protein ERCC-4
LKYLIFKNQISTSNDINTHHVSSKLALLTLHFPKLRILWCSSPYDAAEIFEELKANCPQPNVEMAASIKNNQIGDNNTLRYNPILRVS